MRLSPSGFINEYLNLGDGFKICLFKDNTHQPDAPAHFHFIIPLCDNSNLVVCIVTSQVEKISRMYYDDRECLNALIPVDNHFDFLNRLSVANCNAAEYLTVQELKNRVDFAHHDGFQIKAMDREINSDLKTEIINAIVSSPVVKNHIKSYITGRYLTEQ